METVFSLILMIIAIALIVVLLLQARGSGSSLFGEASSTFRSRRGVEQLLFRMTIVLAVIFVGVAIANVRFSLIRLNLKLIKPIFSDLALFTIDATRLI